MFHLLLTFYFILAFSLDDIREVVKEEIAPMKKALHGVLETMLDPWEAIHSETDSVVADSEKLYLNSISEYYGTNKSHHCMILGKGITHCNIICAHIWPKHTLGKGLDTFELSPFDVSSPRNFLRLHKTIENAFDHKYLYFEICNIEGTTQFKLRVRVLNPDILPILIEYGSDGGKRFEEINGQVGDFIFERDVNSPFTRLLFVHGVRAVARAKKLGWLKEDSQEVIVAREDALKVACSSLEDNSIMNLFLKS